MAFAGIRRNPTGSFTEIRGFVALLAVAICIFDTLDTGELSVDIRACGIRSHTSRADILGAGFRARIAEFTPTYITVVVAHAFNAFLCLGIADRRRCNAVTTAVLRAIALVGLCVAYAACTAIGGVQTFHTIGLIQTVWGVFSTHLAPAGARAFGAKAAIR